MLHCLWFLLIHDSLFKKSGTVLRAHPLHQRSWALKVSKLRLWSLKWRIGKFLEPTYAHMCSSNIVHACVRGRWHGFCGEFLFYMFWGCLGSTILPRKEFVPAKLQTKNQRKNGESCARELLEILGINMFLISGPLFKLGYVHVHTLLF